MPGGVNSPVRAFKGVGGTPKFIDHAKGAYVYDVDGQRYIDYVGSWGPMILGHGDDDVIEAVKKTAEKGLSFGAPCELEVNLAEKIISLIDSIEMIRFVNSGTEATMSAVRVARGFTGRDKIIKFAGCYHGHSDQFLVEAGSGALTLGIPNSPGVPADTVKHTLVAEYNNIDDVTSLFEAQGNDIACVIIEPIAGNMNMVVPNAEFLKKLQDLCHRYGALLIFDEVMTGFRVGLSGAQGLYGIKPDLTTFGKVIGGGMPVGAFGGRKEIMQKVAPVGDIYQAGTLSGNPIAMQAGLTTLQKISAPGFYESVTEKTTRLVDGLNQLAMKYDLSVSARNIGSMFGIYFSDDKELTSFNAIKRCDVKRFNHFFHYMLDHGIYFAPSAFEAGFMSAAHTVADIDYTLRQVEAYFVNFMCETRV